MENYRAPMNQVMFSLKSHAALDKVLQLPAYEAVDGDLVDAVLTEAANFFSNELAPTNQIGDVEGVQLAAGAVTLPNSFVHVYRQYVEQGWAAAFYDESLGGHGLPGAVQFAIIEMMQSANLAFSMCPLLAPAAVDTLRHYAADELVCAYVPQLVSGQWSATMALTEPQAGSDLSLVRTKAVVDGDSYLISGQKIFISFADHNLTENIVHLVLARLPDAPEGIRGISLFLVPKFTLTESGEPGDRNDIQITGIEHKLGLHGSPTCSVSFGDNGGARGYLVGEAHKGLSYMFTMMNHARLQVGSQAVALSQLACQHALAYARERRQGRIGREKQVVYLIEHADVQRMLMTIQSGVEAMRGLVYSTATQMDFASKEGDMALAAKRRARVEWLTPIVKAWNTELAQELVGLCVQIHGGMGFVEETGVAQLVRDARILTIYEGTTGIQAMDLVRRKLLSDGGKSAMDWLADLRQTHTCVVDLGVFANEAGCFDEALGRLESITRKLCEWGVANSASLGHVAYDYLMLCGYVGGGAQLLNGVVASQSGIANGSVADGFREQRATAARFYIANLLPRTLAHGSVVETVMGGADELDPKSFVEY